MTVNANPYIVTSGLVLSLDASNPRSYPGTGSTWYDVSGTGNNGTMGAYNTLQTVSVGGVSAQTIISSKSNPTTSYTTIPNSDSLTIRNNISWAVFCYKTSDSSRQTIMGKSLNSPWDGFYISISRDGIGQLSWWSGSSYGGWWDSGLAVPTNKWVFIAGNWTGTTRKAWLAYNGYSLTSATAPAQAWNSPTDSSNFGIFTEIWQPTSSTYILDGGISYLSVYNTYLTDDQIAQLYNAQRSKYGI